MAEKFLMPKLSPTMEEGQISRWVKNEGDTFEPNETLAEVDTDKATMEMTALQGGTLLKILKQAGDTAALGEAIAITGKEGEDISALLSEVASNGASKKDAGSEGRGDAGKEDGETGRKGEGEKGRRGDEETGRKGEAEKPTSESEPATASATPQSEIREPQSSGNGRLIVSPIAARMAADNGVDLRSISGSGPNGRIIKRDIEEALKSGVQKPKTKDQR